MTIDESILLPARWVAALRNALEIRRLARVRGPARTPYTVAYEERTFRLRRYVPAKSDLKRRPSLVLVPPLMLTAEVYDIAAGGSAVAALLERGIAPWVVDFGAPERERGGLRRTLADHVVAVSRAVDHVHRTVGRKVHLGGYSQGGMFCYQAAAYRRSADLASLITFGSPVDVRRDLLPGLPDEVAGWLLDSLGPPLAGLAARSAVPPWLSRSVFKMLSPMKEIRNQIEFLTRLHDRETALRREGQRRFLAEEGWVAWPGPALRDFVEQFLLQNRLLRGGFVIDGRPLSLADITCPVLIFIGRTDEIARPAAVRAIRDAAPAAELYEVALDAGHFGLVVGAKAMRETWPTVAAWLHWRERGGRRPRAILPFESGAQLEGAQEASSFSSLAGEVAGEVAETVAALFGDMADGARQWLGEITRQLPRIVRITGVRRHTRIGLSLALEEQAENSPDDTFFLYGGRAYTYGDANRRVEAIARGLLAVGVRQGEHVGIYMRSRPSALALTAAVNRVGAVAVLLRPDADLRRQMELGDVQHLIADPDHGPRARRLLKRDVLVLGGGPAPRTLPPGLIDMEAIDPDGVRVPHWYRSSPGRAGDLAFVLFSGRDQDLRANRITNRRWALSAYGTASAAAMTSADRTYCWTPIQHPTGLLVAVGSTVVSGARLALADGFSVKKFWEDVRRYGVSIVFYTGSVCRALVDAPPCAAERGHPVRLFAGSGMPAPLWRRVVERFAPARVLEFYASTEGAAILGNVAGRKIGSAGRPLPGSAEVAVAKFDPVSREWEMDERGFCRAAAENEPGLLLARVDPERGVLEGKPLRNVFEAGDAWFATDHLFRCDEDGDYWLVDHIADVIVHESGWLPTRPIEECVWELDFVSAAAAYGIRMAGRRGEQPAVAIVPRPGASVDPRALWEKVCGRLSPPSRPVVVRIVDRIPMTSGWRFCKEPLRRAGVPAEDGRKGRLLVADPRRRTYRPATDLRRLGRSGTVRRARRRRAGGARS